MDANFSQGSVGPRSQGRRITASFGAEFRLGESSMKRKLLLAAALLASLSSVAGAQGVVYRETFGRPDPATGNINTTLFDWQRFQPTGALAGGGGISSDGTGKPTDLPQTTSAGPVQDGTFNAYAEGWHYMDGTHVLTMTTEFSFDPAASAPVSFNWWLGSNTAAGGGLNDVRVVVRVGGAWYASNEIFTNPSVSAGANFGSTDPLVQGAVERSLIFNPAAANWLQLTFDGDYNPTTDTGTASTVPIALGAAAPAPLSGLITGFGFYRAVSGQNFRVDNVTILGDVPPGGDVDLDDDVDMDDFTIIRNNFQKPATMRSQGDLNGDLVVDFRDFRLWKNDFPFPSEAAAGAVPEPASVMIAILGISFAAAARRRT
jgi:hypothetical protein